MAEAIRPGQADVVHNSQIGDLRHDLRHMARL
jgi:hypothetical protein